MFDTVIAAVDGHPGGRDAAALAARLARGSKLVLAHAYGEEHGPDLASDPGRTRRLREHALELLGREAELAQLDGLLEPVWGRTPGAALATLADDRNADLLVVGSSHRGPVGRVLLGDAGRDVLLHAPCAVAVAPHGFRLDASELATIGVGYDGTPEAERTISAAAALTRALGARLRVLAVAEPSETWAHARRDALARRLEHARHRLALDLAADVVVSDPPAELERFSRAVDLLCVGQRDQTPFERLRHGSVSQHLARHCECALLVVPWRLRERQLASARAGDSATWR
jgi:nucleotide-binding universal stress UspA family protein